MSALVDRYTALVAESAESPWAHVDALLGALLARHPEASVTEAKAWLTAPTAESTRVDSDRGAMIRGEEANHGNR